MDHRGAPRQEAPEDHRPTSAIVFVRGIGETVDWEWEDVDHLLVQFRTRHLIRPNVTYVGNVGVSLRDYYTQRLLPELTRRRLIDVVQYNPRSGPWWYGGYYVAIVVMVSSSRPRLPLTITCWGGSDNSHVVERNIWHSL